MLFDRSYLYPSQSDICFPLLCCFTTASIGKVQVYARHHHPALFNCRALRFRLQSGENSLALQFCFVIPALTSTCSCLNVFFVMVLFCVFGWVSNASALDYSVPHRSLLGCFMNPSKRLRVSGLEAGAVAPIIPPLGSCSSSSISESSSSSSANSSSSSSSSSRAAASEAPAAGPSAPAPSTHPQPGRSNAASQQQRRRNTGAEVEQKQSSNSAETHQQQRRINSASTQE